MLPTFQQIGSIGHHVFGFCPIISILFNDVFTKRKGNHKGSNTWEIDKGMRVPQQCKLSLSWAWIGDQFPRMGAKFVQFDRGSQEGVKKGS